MSIPLPSAVNNTTHRVRENKHPATPFTETLTNGFFTVDNKWTVKYWNKSAEILLNVKVNDIVGKNLWEKFAGVLPLQFYNVYQKAFCEDVPVHFKEYWGEMGAWFDVITYYSGDTLSVSFKSSNQPHAEYPNDPVERLRTLTELYRFVTEITNDCLWEWDLLNREIFWIDGGHKRVLGYPIENALVPQRFWENRIHPDDRPRLLTRLNKILTEGSSSLWEDEYRFQKANGEYAHVHDRGHIIYNRDNRAFRIIGATQDITEKVLLQKKLEEERLIKQREITGAVLTAQEKERTEIGKELHDNLNQVLAVSKMYLEMAMKDEGKRSMYMDSSHELLSNVMEQIRKIAKTMVIHPVHIIGLFDNIKNLVKDLNQVDPIKIEFGINGIREEDLDEKLQVSIFRIVQEQLNNILKHSTASKASIHINRVENEIQLLISDNGKGCDLQKELKGIGIRNIQSRAELYHGHADITSSPGKGYKLKVGFPVEVPGK